MNQNEVQKEIENVCDEIKDLLLKKNKAYGNSALEPKRIFATSSPQEQIAVRIDDKLSRIQNLNSFKDINTGDESLRDTKRDLIGYLILEMVAERIDANE